MKILSAEQIREADRYTMENEPVSSIDLMERAAHAIFQWIITNYDPRKSIAVVCGTGNNGGDGLAVARMLHEHGYSVDAYVINGESGGSEDFQINRDRLPLTLKNIGTGNELPDFDKYQVLIDAIFGTGLSRPAEGLHAEVINRMNSSGAEILSVDMPSGLFSHKSSGNAPTIQASVTLTFQIPKLALLLPENEAAVGEWELIDIRLNQGFIHAQETSYHLITDESAAAGLKLRKKFAHKGDYGHAIIMAGSYGKMGAAVLASKGALRSGIGLLTTYIPRCGYSIIQTAVPEAMTEMDESDHCLSGIPSIKSIDALGIGPGIGMENETVYALEEILRNFRKPMVIDADALNLLSAQIHLQDLVPANSILTPHPGEFARLVGSWENDFERLDKQKELALRLNSVIILKGAHTSVALPDGRVFFNVSGNPGMATGGCGDVLTGILTALLARGITPAQAAVTGVYVHGLAGDIAARYQSQTGMIASDLVDYLPDAWAMLEA